MRKLSWLALLGALFIGACVYDVPVTVEHEIPVDQAILGASHSFKEGSLKSWTLNAQISYTKNDSNVAIFEYDRTIFEVNMRSYF